MLVQRGINIASPTITCTTKSQQVLAVIMNARTHAFMHTRTFSYRYSLTQHVQTAICWSIAHTHTHTHKKLTHALYFLCLLFYSYSYFTYFLSFSLYHTHPLTATPTSLKGCCWQSHAMLITQHIIAEFRIFKLILCRI